MATVFLENLGCSEKIYGILGRAANSKPERGFDENPHERDVNCRCAGHESRATINLVEAEQMQSANNRRVLRLDAKA